MDQDQWYVRFVYSSSWHPSTSWAHYDVPTKYNVPRTHSGDPFHVPTKDPLSRHMWNLIRRGCQFRSVLCTLYLYFGLSFLPLLITSITHKFPLIPNRWLAVQQRRLLMPPLPCPLWPSYAMASASCSHWR